MKPLVERLEKTYSGKVEIRKLNVEQDQAAIELAQKMNVQYVPTFVFVNADGIVANSVVGEMTEDALTSALQSLK